MRDNFHHKIKSETLPLVGAFPSRQDKATSKEHHKENSLENIIEISCLVLDVELWLAGISC